MEHLQESLEGFIEKLRVVGVIAGDYQLDNPAILKDKVYVSLRDRQAVPLVQRPILFAIILYLDVAAMCVCVCVCWCVCVQPYVASLVSWCAFTRGNLCVDIPFIQCMCLYG